MKKRSLLILVGIVCFSALVALSTAKTKSPAGLVGSTASSSSTVAQDELDVSMIKLLANPEKYQGRKVRIIGFVRLEFEGNAVYFHQDDFKHGISKNALWINTNKEIETARQKYDQKYVLIQGTFNAQFHGHMGLFGGAIYQIERFEVWSDPNKGR